MRHVRIPTLTLSTIALLLSASTALAVKPQAWTFAAQKDFAEGRFTNTVVDSYGQLSLGRNLTPIKLDSPAEMITAFAQTEDGSLFVSTSPSAKIYRIDKDKTALIYTAPKGFTDITALAADNKGNLLVALSGDTARLVRITAKSGDNKPASSIRFEDKDVDYIWAIQQSADGSIYLGTGSHGKIYKLPEKNDGGEVAVVLDTKGKNITALATDKAGNLLAGTDSPGLVIRIDSKTNKPFVLLDAGKVDVNAIVTAPDGNIYVATAKAEPADNSDNSEEEPTGKSKPAATEPDSIEPADPDANPTTKPHAALPAFTSIFAAPKQDIPPAIKALLKKAAAEASGKKPGPSKKHGPMPPSKSEHFSPRASDNADESSTDDASSIYKISPEGTGGVVTTLLQQEDLNYSLLLNGDDLLIGTGDQGKLYSYHLPDQSLTLLARLKEEHITTLFADSSGSVLLGTANAGAIYRLGSDLAPTGTFISQTLDASHSANWGHANIELDLPPGTKATIATRTGNTHNDAGSDTEKSGWSDPKFWSDWSEEADATKNEKISSPVARYFQYRLTLTGDGKSVTPALNKIRIAYQTENLPPELKNLAVDLTDSSTDNSDNAPDSPNDGPPTSDKLSHITWDSSDPNNDTLTYKIYYKLASNKDIWTIVVKDLSDTLYEWDTKSLADGKYIVKVIASDSPDNDPASARQTARSSAPFIIDHTPPVIADLTPTVDANTISLKSEATDALSAISDVRYQIDGQGDWQPAAASDKIFDSPHEGFTIVTRPLAAGGHRITVRVTDAKGNASYKTATIAVKP